MLLNVCDNMCFYLLVFMVIIIWRYKITSVYLSLMNFIHRFQSCGADAVFVGLCCLSDAVYSRGTEEINVNLLIVIVDERYEF